MLWNLLWKQKNMLRSKLFLSQKKFPRMLSLEPRLSHMKLKHFTIILQLLKHTRIKRRQRKLWNSNKNRNLKSWLRKRFITKSSISLLLRQKKLKLSRHKWFPYLFNQLKMKFERLYLAMCQHLNKSQKEKIGYKNLLISTWMRMRNFQIF